jgi:hypothetical protein
MLDPAITERIRSIFLQEQPRVTIDRAAELLGRTKADLKAAIRSGDIETIETCSGPQIDARELAEQALHVWPILAIEEALGKEASLILPPGVRSHNVTFRLPRYLIQTIHCLAALNGETGEALLARELHGLAHAHRAPLAKLIPDLEECVDWPLVEYAHAS